MVKTIPLRLATALLAILGTLCAAQLEAGDRPNVVLMLSDNLGYGDIGAYGSGGDIRGMPTPNLDQLASDGLMLTQFFVEPGCTPSRAGLMTGRYSVRSGLNSIIVAGTPLTLQDEEFTIAELFKEHGYATGMVGKWHLGQEEQSWPTSQGFDEYRVGILETTDGTLYPESMRRTGLPESVIEATQPRIWESDEDGTLKPVRVYDLDYRRQVEGDIADAAGALIASHAKDDEPFFLYVGWSHVHYPSEASQEFMGRSAVGAYGDVLMEHDHRLGEVLNAINAAGIRDNTLVVYLSDNGPSPTKARTMTNSVAQLDPFAVRWAESLGEHLGCPGWSAGQARSPPPKATKWSPFMTFCAPSRPFWAATCQPTNPSTAAISWIFSPVKPNSQRGKTTLTLSMAR